MGKEGFEQGLCVSRAGRAVGEGVAQFFQGVVTEEEPEEGEVGECGVPGVFGRGVPQFRAVYAPVRDLESEAGGVEAEVEGGGMAGCYGIGEPLLEDWRDLDAR